MKWCLEADKFFCMVTCIHFSIAPLLLAHFLSFAVVPMEHVKTILTQVNLNIEQKCITLHQKAKCSMPGSLLSRIPDSTTPVNDINLLIHVVFCVISLAVINYGNGVPRDLKIFL